MRLISVRGPDSGSRGVAPGLQKAVSFIDVQDALSFGAVAHMVDEEDMGEGPREDYDGDIVRDQVRPRLPAVPR